MSDAERKHTHQGVVVDTSQLQHPHMGSKAMEKRVIENQKTKTIQPPN